MRLLNVNNYAITSFTGEVSDIYFPRYAILSHTWEDDEVTYQDFSNLLKARSKHGFRKIAKCCTRAKKDGLSWVWIDTCCIDKTSSVELSEAINSMYKWYEAATVCYVLLADFDCKKHEVDSSTLRSCRWFSRGWTLQELIAPVHVMFYDTNWIELAAKSAIAEMLTEITRIPTEVLKQSVSRLSVPVADRMSWAGDRNTTRVEDEAYCLLGIFDVNMPLLYGEGSRAFTRLQAEILRSCNDDTIFLGGVLRTIDPGNPREAERALATSWSGRWLSGPYEPGNNIAVPDPNAFRIEPPALHGSRVRIDMPMKEVPSNLFYFISPEANATGNDPGNATIVWGALNCLHPVDKTQRLARFFKVISHTFDQAGPVLHLEPLDSYSTWFHATEVESWNMARCIISMTATLRYAIKTPSYREKQHSVALLMTAQVCTNCTSKSYGWKWLRRASKQDPESQHMTHTYLLERSKQKKGKEKPNIGLIFLVPSQASDGACRLGLFELPWNNSIGSLNLLWEVVQHSAKSLMSGKNPPGVGGVWSDPLIEGPGPRARVIHRVHSCCYDMNMVVTLFCGQTSKGHVEFVPELRFESPRRNDI